MWVVEGEFATGAVSKKLLKPGKTYDIGRRDPAHLVFESRTVSQDAFSIIVGPFTTEDVPNFSTRPTLIAYNKHDTKNLTIHRQVPGGAEDETTSVHVEPGRNQVPLQDGDKLQVSSAKSLKVMWHPTEFSTGPQVNANEVQDRMVLCAEVGVHLSMPSRSWVDGSSHVCTPQVKGSPLIMKALANAAHIVTLDYLDDLVLMGRRSLTDRDTMASLSQTTPLEKCFEVPDVLNHEPAFVGDLANNETASAQLKSDPRRKTMLVGATGLFLYASEEAKKRLSSAVGLFKACGGRTEEVAVSSLDLSSKAQAQRALSKYQTSALSWYSSCGDIRYAPDRGLVILVDRPADYPEWHRNLAHATREAEIRMPDAGIITVANAVFHTDPREYLNKTASNPDTQSSVSSSEGATNAATAATSPPTTATAAPAASTAASGAPSTEPASSIPAPTGATAGSSAPPTLRNPANSASGAESGADVAPAPTAAMGPPAPRRRAGQHKTVNTLDQLFGNPTPSSAQAITQGTSRSQAEGSSGQDRPTTQGASTQQRTGTKRHARAGFADFFGVSGGTQTAGGADGGGNADADESFRKSKRFRLQIEQEDQAAANGESEGSTSRSPERTEEQDATEPQQAEPTRATQAAAAEDADMDTGEGSSRSKGTGKGNATQDARRKASARAAAEAAPSQVIRTQKGPRGKGAGEQPDSEPMFLQALAMKKKGKNQQIDDFDREFNNLRLQKPQQKDKKDEEYEAWEQLNDFGDAPIGNFVRVDFVPLLRAERSSTTRETAGEGSKWQGLPNFKRFRPKGQRKEAQSKTRRAPVAMDLTEGHDFGLGGDYGERIKPKVFGLRELEPEDDESMVMKPRAAQSKKGAGKGRLFPALQGSSDGEEEPQRNRRKAVRGARRDRDDGDGDDSDGDPDLRLAANVEDVDLSLSRTTTRPSTSRNKGRSAARSKAATQMDEDGDESEEDFGRRRTAGKRSRAQRYNDDDDGGDDSDSDGGFKGFGRRATKTKRTR